MDSAHSISTLQSDAASPGRLAEASGLRQFIERLNACDADASRMGRLFLDGFLSELGCERGFLLRGTLAPEDDGDDGPSIQVVSARTVQTVASEAGHIEIVDQADAELYIEPSVVERAIGSDEIVVERECAVEMPPPGGEIRRTVLCRAFSLSTTQMGVLYLDAPVVEPHAVDDLAADCEALLSHGLAHLRNVYLEDEVRQLRARAGTPSTPSSAREEGESAGDEDGEGAWDLEDGLPSFHGIIGKSPRLFELFSVVERIKDTDFNVCIFGESGSGKEILARAIHRAGSRRDASFISENCGAISENLLESELFGHVKGSFTGADETRQGLFELADGGTLFLDEIGDMSEGMQRKLLRVLQEGVIRPIGSKETIRVNVRVICASNRDLKVLMEKGQFRADLYYRLNVISLQVPPLRERIDDIPFLVKHFLSQLRQQGGARRRLSQSALKALMSYNWPGNVRELANVLQRLMVAGGKKIITRKEVLPLLSGGPARSYVSEDLDREESENEIVLRIPQRQTFNEIIAECEKAVLLNALKENRWNKSRVTKVLRIPRQSLYNKIAKYDLRKRGAVEES